MKKFNFSLQKVLEIKEQVLENSKIELSRLNDDLKNIDSSINNLRFRFSEINYEFNNKSSKAISIGELSYYKVLMSNVLRQIENKEEDKQIVIRKIETKRQEIININMEISSLEKLRENELNKYNKALLKSEEIFIEEFVSNKSISNGYAI